MHELIDFFSWIKGVLLKRSKVSAVVPFAVSRLLVNNFAEFVRPLQRNHDGYWELMHNYLRHLFLRAYLHAFIVTFPSITEFFITFNLPSISVWAFEIMIYHF